MRTRIIAEIDDIQDRSDASAVAKKISLLDALHLVAMSWKRVSERTIENCFRKGGFSKTKAELLLPKNLILQVKFSMKPQTACQEKNLKIGWIYITMLK
jgi:hypothetical protein